MEPFEAARQVFSPLLVRFLSGVDHTTRPVKISDSGRIRNEMQTMIPQALEHANDRIRVRFERINEMVLSPDAKTLFVACSNSTQVSVLDTQTGQGRETISCALHPKAPSGNTPNSLCLTPDGQLLFVANADANNKPYSVEPSIGRTEAQQVLIKVAAGGNAQRPAAPRGQATIAMPAVGHEAPARSGLGENVTW
jgi:DNA-binding beta-propeller fold protein YncE